MKSVLSKLVIGAVLSLVILSFAVNPILAASFSVNLSQNSSSSNTSYSGGGLKLSTQNSNLTNPSDYTLSEYAFLDEYEDYSLMAYDSDNALLYIGGSNEIIVIDTKDNADPYDDTVYGVYDSTYHAIFDTASFRDVVWGYAYNTLSKFFVDSTSGYMYIPSADSYVVIIDTQNTKTIDDDVVVGSYSTFGYRPSNVTKMGTTILISVSTGLLYYQTNGTETLADDVASFPNAVCSWVCLTSGHPIAYDGVNDYLIAGKSTTYPSTSPYYGGVHIVDLNTSSIADDTIVKSYLTPGYESTDYVVNDFYWDNVNNKFYFSSQYGLVVYDTKGTASYLDDTHEFTYNATTFPELAGNAMRNFEVDSSNNRILIDNAVINTNGTSSQADDTIEKVFDNNYFMEMFSSLDGDLTTIIDLNTVYYDIDNNLAYLGFYLSGRLYNAVVSLDGYLPSTSREIKVSDFSQGTWENMDSMDLARVGAAYGVINGKFYVASGTRLWDDTETSEVYDPVANSWSYIASMPISLVAPASAVYNGKLYVVGGRDNAYDVQSGLYAYNPGSDTWDTLSPMPTARNSPSGSVLNGKFYVVGGMDTLGDPLDVLEVYDFATNSWTTGTPAPITIANGHVFQAVNGKIYLMGGYFGSSTDPNYTVAVYDPATDTWDTNLSTMPTPRSGLSSLIYQDNIIVFGGTDYYTGPVESVFAYNVTNDIWFKLPPLPAMRHRVSVGIIGDYLYVAGGKSESWTGANNVYRISVSDYLSPLRNWDTNLFTWTNTLPANTALTVSVSTNGGESYTTIPSTGSYSIPSIDSRLFTIKYQMTTSNRAVTPTVTNSNISYSYYSNSGEYISKVTGSTQKVKWNSFSKTDSKPAGSSATYSVRFGDSTNPDGSWTGWLNTSQVANKEYRYAQVKINLSTTDTTLSPSVQTVSFDYSDIPASEPEPTPQPTPTPTPVVPNDEEPVDDGEDVDSPSDDDNEEPESPPKEESHVVVIYGPDGEVLANTTVKIGNDVYRTDNKGRLYLSRKPVKKTNVEVLVDGKWVGAVLGEDDTQVIITKEAIEKASKENNYGIYILSGATILVLLVIILIILFKRNSRDEESI